LGVEHLLLGRHDCIDEAGRRLALRRRLLGECLTALEVRLQRRDRDAEVVGRRSEYVHGEDPAAAPARTAEAGTSEAGTADARAAHHSEARAAHHSEAAGAEVMAAGCRGRE